MAPGIIEERGDHYKIEYPTTEKVLWLTRVLHAIAATKLAKEFALMGGSAIVFLYRDLYRFSTDIDLDFIGNASLGRRGSDEIAARIEAHRAMIEEIARDLGMKFLVRGKPANRFVQYGLQYSSAYTRTGLVELDMSYRYCHSALEPLERTWPLQIPDLVPRFKVQTLQLEELYAGKVVAMLEGKNVERIDFPGHIGLMFKRKIRHLFDVCLFAEDIEQGRLTSDIELLHRLVVLFGLTRIVNFRYFRGNSIGSYDDTDVEDELRGVVPRGMNIPTVDQMKWTVRKFFDKHIFNWGETEHRFVEDYLSGNFRPADLFGKGTVANRLREMHYYQEILGKVKAM